MSKIHSVFSNRAFLSCKFWGITRGNGNILYCLLEGISWTHKRRFLMPGTGVLLHGLFLGRALSSHMVWLHLNCMHTHYFIPVFFHFILCCIGVLPACIVCVPGVCGGHVDQNRALGPFRTGITVVSHLVGAKNQTQVSWKRSQWVLLTAKHLSSLWFMYCY